MSQHGALRAIVVFGCALVIASATNRASAYDAQTTHVGLTERAAAAARLHEVLARRWGRPLGLFEPIRMVMPAALRERLERLSPIEGLLPDGQGENTALGWLLAGAALEEVPAVRGRNHFFDPRSGQGLHQGGGWTRLFFWFFGDREVGGSFHLAGRSAPEWAAAPAADNDLGLEVLLGALEHMASARARPERDTASAKALLAMGAMAHVLEDMASPSHVRNDFRGAHLSRVPSSSIWDKRSRYERYVARQYGRLSVPGISALVGVRGEPPVPTTFRAAFVGLARYVQPRFFSAGTLPEEVVVDGAAQEGPVLAALAQNLPYGQPRIEHIDPTQSVGFIRSREVPVLAEYEVEHGKLSLELGDATHETYARMLLPRAVLATAGLLRFLTRGALGLEQKEGGWVVENRGAVLSSGTLQLLIEDAQGVRRLVATLKPSFPAASGVELGRVAITSSMASARRVIALFRGRDGADEPLVAIQEAAGSNLPQK